MGQEAEKAGRLKSFAGYQVDTKVGNSSEPEVSYLSYSNLGKGSKLWDSVIRTRP